MSKSSAFRTPSITPRDYGTEETIKRNLRLRSAMQLFNSELALANCPVRIEAQYMDCEAQLAFTVVWD